MGRKKIPSVEVYKGDEARRSNMDRQERNDQRNKKELITKEQTIAAFNECSSRAKKGDKKAQYDLARMYATGSGTECDPEQAIFQYKVAAEGSEGNSGNRDAQYQLGIIYLTGWGKTTEPPQAGLALLLQAANQGHVEAQRHLAVIYDPFRVSAYANKVEIQKNLEESTRWFIKAAESGDVASQLDLGKKYEEGCGVDKDEEKALVWLVKAAETYKEAQFYLGKKYQEGRGVKKNEAKAFELLSQAANKGHKEAVAYLQDLTGVIRPHNVYPETKQLIEATQQVLGENCRVDVSRMFYRMWHEGISTLKDETFYYYTYQLCSSQQDIPETMRQGTVYLYIEGDKLHYQVMNRCSNDLLAKFSFSKVPLKDGAVRKIYYVRNETELTYDCTIVDQEGAIYKISIPAQPEDDEQRIQHKIKEKLKEVIVEVQKGALYVYHDSIMSVENEKLGGKDKQARKMERKRELLKLRDVTFPGRPLTDKDDIRQIAYWYNTSHTNCVYTVVTDKQELEVGQVDIAPQDEEDEIRNKILIACASSGKNYFVPKEEYYIFLQQRLNEKLGGMGCLEPSYEVKKGLENAYGEIVKLEENLLEFLEKLIAILNHADFIEIFKGDEKFEGLRLGILSLATQLSRNQRAIQNVFSRPTYDSSQMIDNLKNVYSGANINLEAHYQMVILIQNLQSLIDENSKSNPKTGALINLFFQQNPGLIMGAFAEINFSVLFSGQFSTRRRLTLRAFSDYFREKHCKFYELESAFCLVEKFASTTNLAQSMSSPADISKSDNESNQAILRITSTLGKENNKLKKMCFNLVKSIWNILGVEVQQTGSMVIYKTLVVEKGRILTILLDLSQLIQLLLKKEIFKNLSAILTEEELAKLIDAVANKESLYPAGTNEIQQIVEKATCASPWPVDKQGMAQIITKTIVNSDYYSIYKEVINLTKEIEETCNLNHIISCLVKINKLISTIATMNNINMGDCPEEMRSPTIGRHKVERYLSGGCLKENEDTTDSSSEHTFSLGAGQPASEDGSSNSTPSPQSRERQVPNLPSSPRKECRIPDLPLSPWREDRKFNTVTGNTKGFTDEKRLAMSGPSSPKRSENNNIFTQLSSKKSQPFTISSPLSPKRGDTANNSSLPTSPKKAERSLALSGAFSLKRNDDNNILIQSPKRGDGPPAMPGSTSPKSNQRQGQEESTSSSGRKSRRKVHMSDHSVLTSNASADNIPQRERRKSLKLPGRVHSNLSSVAAFFGNDNSKEPEISLGSSQKLSLDP